MNKKLLYFKFVVKLEYLNKQFFTESYPLKPEDRPYEMEKKTKITRMNFMYTFLLHAVKKIGKRIISNLIPIKIISHTNIVLK